MFFRIIFTLLGLLSFTACHVPNLTAALAQSNGIVVPLVIPAYSGRGLSSDDSITLVQVFVNSEEGAVTPEPAVLSRTGPGQPWRGSITVPGEGSLRFTAYGSDEQDRVQYTGTVKVTVYQGMDSVSIPVGLVPVRTAGKVYIYGVLGGNYEKFRALTQILDKNAGTSFIASTSPDSEGLFRLEIDPVESAVTILGSYYDYNGDALFNETYKYYLPLNLLGKAYGKGNFLGDKIGYFAACPEMEAGTVTLTFPSGSSGWVSVTNNSPPSRNLGAGGRVSIDSVDTQLTMDVYKPVGKSDRWTATREISGAYTFLAFDQTAFGTTLNFAGQTYATLSGTVTVPSEMDGKNLKITLRTAAGPNYSDTTQEIAITGTQVAYTFTSVPNNARVEILAYLDANTEGYDSDWAGSYGRSTAYPSPLGEDYDLTVAGNRTDLDFNLHRIEGTTYPVTITANVPLDGQTVTFMDSGLFDRSWAFQFPSGTGQSGVVNMPFPLVEEFLNLGVEVMIRTQLAGDTFIDTLSRKGDELNLAFNFLFTPPTATSLEVTLTGDDAAQFKLRLNDFNNESPEADVQVSPATWNLTYIGATKDYLVDAFMDVNSNNLLDEGELRVGSWLSTTQGQLSEESIQLGKSIITVTLTGDPGIFTHPLLVHNRMRSGSASYVEAPCVDQTQITTYGNRLGSSGDSGILQAVDDLNNNGKVDHGEPAISDEVTWSYSPTKAVTINLYATAPEVLPDDQKVGFDINSTDSGPAQYPSDLDHYRFIVNPSGPGVLLLLPEGSGTDGDFITCSGCPDGSHSGDHLWELFNLVYAGNSTMRNGVNQNYSTQLVEWKQNVKDLVAYLENTKSFTVYGKELLPPDWWQ